MLGLARAAIRVLPFRSYVGLLGRKAALSDASPAGTLDPRTATRIATIRQAVASAAAIAPWTANCLPQALVACILLRASGVPHRTFLGTAKGQKGGDPLLAHAWVRAGDVIVTGKRGAARHTVVAHFAWPPAPAAPER